MLDQLVESRNHTSEHKKFGGFMLSTGVVLVTVLTVGLVLSLFNQNIVFGGGFSGNFNFTCARAC